MGKLHTEIGPEIVEFIRAQRIFFVATAPIAGDGHVNLSPKGWDTFCVLDARRVAYVDLTGSGIETVAHVRENGRITFMFCAFEGVPRILRLYGQGEVIEPGDGRFDEIGRDLPVTPGRRAIIHAHIDRVADSCGYAVPLYRYEGERTQLRDWMERKGAEGLAHYQAEKNAQSIDGLPGLARPRMRH